MKKILGVLQTTRFFKSLAITVIVSYGANSFTYGIAMLLFLLFSFAFNDYVDANKDAVGHPARAIPSGKISRLEGLILSYVLLMFGWLAASALTDSMSYIFLVLYMLSSVYSLILKPYLPLLGTVVWSVVVAILLLMPFSVGYIEYVSVTIIVYAYEMMLDSRDYESDMIFCKSPTVAHVFDNWTPVVAISIACIGGAIAIIM